MNSLHELLGEKETKPTIEKTLVLGNVSWGSILGRIETWECNGSVCDDEQIWTFLVPCSYAMAGASGARKLTGILTENQAPADSTDKIWFEAMPVPPRCDEGNTHLDLAVGNIEQRKNTKSGIAYDGADGGSVCFCECKWLSDIDAKVSHDLHRNQFVRVIENALYFRKVENERTFFPEQIHVTLITPVEFKCRPQGSRLYFYKYHEYQADLQTVKGDMDTCCLTLRSNIHLEDRLSKLHLHWISFEELFASCPESAFKAPFETFIKNYMNSDKRKLLKL